MTDASDLDTASRDLSRRSRITMTWLVLAIVGAAVAVFTLPRGVLGLLVIGSDHTTSIVLTIIGGAVTAIVLFLLWRWAGSLRTQRSEKRSFDERVAEAAGIVEVDEPDGGIAPQT